MEDYSLKKKFPKSLNLKMWKKFKNYLRGIPDYAKYMDQYPLEKALDTQLAETYDLIARITPDNSQGCLQILTKKMGYQKY